MKKKAAFIKKHLDLITIVVLFVGTGLTGFLAYYLLRILSGTDNILVIVVITITCGFFMYLFYISLAVKLTDSNLREKVITAIKKREDRQEELEIHEKRREQKSGMLSEAETGDHGGKLSHSADDGGLSKAEEGNE